MVIKEFQKGVKMVGAHLQIKSASFLEISQNENDSKVLFINFYYLLMSVLNVHGL